MKNKRCLLVAIVLMLLTGCYSKGGLLDFDKEITVRKSVYGDTVHTSLVIRNRGKEMARVNVIPECDCTVIFPESVSLKPHSRQELQIAYYVNTVSYYEKYIYLEWDGTGMTDTIVIKGNLQR